MIEHMFESTIELDPRGTAVASAGASRQGQFGEPGEGPWAADEVWPPDDMWPPDDALPEESRAPWERLSGIEDVPPDGMLALVLEEVDITAVDDQMLVETTAGWQRIVAWAELNSALAAAELSRRPSMNPHWRGDAPTRKDVAGDELAMRLSWSRRAAERLVRDGRCLENELLLTAEAVRGGLIDGARMRVMTDRLHDRPGQLAWAVQEQVLPGAATRTPRQLADDVDRALLDVDPVDAADRLARAVARRRVCHPKRLPDGMAGIWAVLPADGAVLVDGTLEATARAARALGDPRTIDQLRADVFVALATGQAPAPGSGLPADGQAGAIATIAREDERGGRCAPAAPAPDEVGEGDEIDEDGACDASNGDRASKASGAERQTVGPAPETGSHPPDAPPGPPKVRVPRIRIDVTVALSTLMGLDEKPAELAGFGPISAEQARALAAGGVWRRLVTDPLTGRVLDVGRTRYRPPRSLVEHVTARDGVCASPCCSVPADRCDLDHTEEFHGTARRPGTGTTAASNLGPLSSRCHRIKTDGGFTLTQPQPGVFEWRTPAGLTYRVVPGDHGRTERLSTAPQRSSGYPDEPPF